MTGIAYVIIGGTFGDDLHGMLMTADGEILASHVSSSREWLRLDLTGASHKGGERWAAFSERYPEEPQIVFVEGWSNAPAELRAAFEAREARSEVTVTRLRKRLTRSTEGLRWRIAGMANRLPWFCWADLVDWALHNRTRAKDRFPMPSRVTSCRQDAASIGYCYCAKFRTCGFEAQYQAGPGIVVPSDQRNVGAE